ncbi:MAG: ABC transporter permease [Ignavibacteriota bacterium]
MLRLGTTLGTWFRKDAPSREDPEVVISYRFWQSRFGGDPGVVGRQVRLLMSTGHVVGVASRDFTGTHSP